MTDSATSAPESGEGQDPAATTPVATAAAAPDRTRELESRIAGLDAARTELQKERDALLKKVAGLESGQITVEETSKATIESKEKEIADLKRQLQVTSLKAQYPKAAEKLGDNIAGIPNENLADLEASLTAALAPAAPAEPPRPVPSNAPDADGNTARDLSRDEVARRAAAEMRAMFGGGMTPT